MKLTQEVYARREILIKLREEKELHGTKLYEKITWQIEELNWVLEESLQKIVIPIQPYSIPTPVKEPEIIGEKNFGALEPEQKIEIREIINKKLTQIYEEKGSFEEWKRKDLIEEICTVYPVKKNHISTQISNIMYDVKYEHGLKKSDNIIEKKDIDDKEIRSRIDTLRGKGYGWTKVATIAKEEFGIPFTNYIVSGYFESEEIGKKRLNESVYMQKIKDVNPNELVENIEKEVDQDYPFDQFKNR